MRVLFIHRTFPGQFVHLVRHLARSRQHEIVFITGENANTIPGVRKAMYRLGPAPPVHPDAEAVEEALRRAAVVAQAGEHLKRLGFCPDVIVGHHGWGETLNLPDTWPGVPVLGYFEFFYRTHGLDVGFDPEFPPGPAAFARVRARNAVALLALQNPGAGITPTAFQRASFPDWAQSRIALLPEGVDLQRCAPDPAARTRPFALGDFAVQPGERLLTYVARELEPYRGFHTVMRALPSVLRARADVKAVLLGGDGVAYGVPPPGGGSWRAHMLREVGAELDQGRVCFPGKVDYATYLRVLQRSDLHVHLTYPFVASWSLREALACGCALVASGTAPVEEFVTEGETGLLTPCLDPARLAERVLEVMDNPALAARLRTAARAFAEQSLRLDRTLAAYETAIAGLLGR